jgi:hypothetical protein
MTRCRQSRTDDLSGSFVPTDAIHGTDTARADAQGATEIDPSASAGAH